MNSIFQSVASTEEAISRYDDVARQLKNAATAIQSSKSEAAELRANNDGGLSVEVRAKKLAQANALVEIQEADLTRLVHEVDTQKKAIAAASDDLRGRLLGELNSRIYARLEEILSELSKDYDFAQCAFPPTQFAACHHAIAALKQVECGLLMFPTDDEQRIDFVRKIRSEILTPIG